jgi:DNA-binding beta-propeller fold protein YncE
VYIPHGAGVSVIDTASNAVVATVPSPIPVAQDTYDQDAGDVAVSDGRHVYIGLWNDRLDPEPDTYGVLVIDASSNAAIAAVPIAGRVLGIAITRDSRHAYIAHSNGLSVFEIGG